MTVHGSGSTEAPGGRPLRTALIGFGVGGRLLHAPYLAADPDFELAAIVTSDPERQEQARAAHPAATLVARPEDLRLADYDLVIITTPNETHADLASTAIRAGVPVVLDKPITSNVADAHRLVEQAAQAGVPLTVYQNRRWDSDFLTVKALVADGSLGTIHEFESRFTWWDPDPAPSWKTQTPPERGGGVLFDLGPHLIDQAMLLFGPVAQWHAELDVRRPGVVPPDQGLLLLTHANGVRSRLWMGCATPLAGPRVRVVGSRAVYTKQGLDPQEAQAGAGLSPNDPTYGLDPDGAWGVIGTDQETSRVPGERGRYAEFFRLLARALRGEGPLPVDPADSIRVLELIEDIHRSVRS